MKLIEKLDTLIAHPRKNGINSGRVVSSLRDLRENGFARTGFSQKTGADSWTEQVIKALEDINISCESGNDAPRGGKNGEFVCITSPAILAIIKKEIAERKRIADAERQRQQNKFSYMLNTVARINNGFFDDFLSENKERILQERPNKSTKKSFWERIAKSLNTFNCMQLRDAINTRVRAL